MNNWLTNGTIPSTNQECRYCLKKIFFRVFHFEGEKLKKPCKNRRAETSKAFRVVCKWLNNNAGGANVCPLY